MMEYAFAQFGAFEIYLQYRENPTQTTNPLYKTHEKVNLMEYRIVNFEESLIEEIVTMWRPSKKLAFGQEGIHSVEEDRAFIKNILSKENTIQIAIDSKNGKVLGMIAFTENTISQLYIDVGCINQGIGTKLLDIAKEQSTGKLELFTFQRNQIAINFYEKNGFVEVGRNYENELNLPDIKYCWEK